MQNKNHTIPLFSMIFLLLILAGCQPGSSRPKPQPGPDSDGDWVSDSDEDKFGTDPSKWDSDDDGATDFEEIFIVGSDPLVAEDDSDEDGNRDITEKNLYNTDPDVADEDRDGDGIPDSVELQKGSDPGKLDTDGDILSDYLELYLTDTDPAVADPINEYGFPVPLEPWLPPQLQNTDCKLRVGANIDRLYVADPEEADGNDINIGDEIQMYYGLWLNADQEDDLFFNFFGNAAYSKGWNNFGLLKGDEFTTFAALDPIQASCGEVVTLAIQVFETDAPWGGDRNFGLYRDNAYLTFNRIPLEWAYGSTGMIFEGTGGDSATYEYDIDYTFEFQR